MDTGEVCACERDNVLSVCMCVCGYGGRRDLFACMMESSQPLGWMGGRGREARIFALL